MRTTKFELHHQTLLHLLVIGLALLTYLINPDDIVWSIVHLHANAALLIPGSLACPPVISISEAYESLVGTLE